MLTSPWKSLESEEFKLFFKWWWYQICSVTVDLFVTWIRGVEFGFIRFLLFVGCLYLACEWIYKVNLELIRNWGLDPVEWMEFRNREQNLALEKAKKKLQDEKMKGEETQRDLDYIGSVVHHLKEETSLDEVKKKLLDDSKWKTVHWKDLFERLEYDYAPRGSRKGTWYDILRKKHPNLPERERVVRPQHPKPARGKSPKGRPEESGSDSYSSSGE